MYHCMSADKFSLSSYQYVKEDNFKRNSRFQNILSIYVWEKKILSRITHLYIEEEDQTMMRLWSFHYLLSRQHKSFHSDSSPGYTGSSNLIRACLFLCSWYYHSIDWPISYTIFLQILTFLLWNS